MFESMIRNKKDFGDDTQYNADLAKVTYKKFL